MSSNTPSLAPAASGSSSQMSTPMRSGESHPAAAALTLAAATPAAKAGAAAQAVTAWTFAAVEPYSPEGLLALLAPLRDESSAYALVAKSCLHWCQWAGHGAQATSSHTNGTTAHGPTSSSTTTTTTTTTIITTGSVLFHEKVQAPTCSIGMEALVACLQQHRDRRARMLAAATLARLARAAYARCRPSPVLMTMRDAPGEGWSHMEDQVANDIPMALVTAALEDIDDGVAGAACEALYHLISSTTAAAADPYEPGQRALLALAHGARPSPYAPSPASAGLVAQEDPLLLLTCELRPRILENIVAPRLWALLDRVVVQQQGASRSSPAGPALPLLTAGVMHLWRQAPALHWTLDRSMYAKRWMDVDVAGLASTLVRALLLPLLQQDQTGAAALAAAWASLPLVHCVQTGAASSTSAPWASTLIQWTLWTLQEEYTAGNPLLTPSTTTTTTTTTTSSSINTAWPLETKLTLLAGVVLAARMVPAPERLAVWCWMVPHLQQGLPRTVPAPPGLWSTQAGLYMDDVGGSEAGGGRRRRQVRRPARMALWTEMALSLFLDGPDPPSSPSSGGSAAAGGGSWTRPEVLAKFLAHPSVVAILQQPPGESTVLPTCRDELLLAFTAVAVETGRRFRVVAGSTSSQPTPASNPVDVTLKPVQDWFHMAYTVLQSFSSCVLAGPRPAYLDEDLTLITAGLATYVQLWQEYLHFMGLLSPPSSVSFKLTANACPPHILWDRLTESATFLTKCPMMMMMSPFPAYLRGPLADQTAKLMEELVSREKKTGLPSHHLRLFILALASDHWVQARIQWARQVNPEAATSQSTQQLQANSAREILMTVSPKRLLAKIFEAHVAPPDHDARQRRDPVKKLALETGRVCVACIENMALVACEWRRRFGPSQEAKHLVSLAVGILQGKTDDGPVDETTRAIMGPLADAAVNRIQSSYEGDSRSDKDGFSLSDLLSQPVKTKIKPLLSSSKPPRRPKDELMKGYWTQICRQITFSRIYQAIQSFTYADPYLLPARPTNWLRLAVPPIPASKDGRVYGVRGDAMAAWGHSATTCSAASDATQVTMAYTMKRVLRYDGEEEFRLAVIVRVFNMTAVSFPEGLRLDLGVVPVNDCENDPVTLDFVESLGCQLEDFTLETPLASSSIVYKQEVNSGDYLTWEVTFGEIPEGRHFALVPTIIYRNIPMESEDKGAKWVGDKSGFGGEASTTTGGDSKAGEDDFQVTATSDRVAKSKGDEVATDNIAIVGEPLPLSPMIGLMPCPLVFFRDRCGDIDTFRFIWFRSHICLAPLRISDSPGKQYIGETDQNITKLARMASLTWEGEAIPGGYVSKVWAFQTSSGYRILCALAESSGEETVKLALHFRGDNKTSLYSLVSSKEVRRIVVAALMPGKVPIG